MRSLAALEPVPDSQCRAVPELGSGAAAAGWGTDAAAPASRLLIFTRTPEVHNGATAIERRSMLLSPSSEDLTVPAAPSREAHADSVGGGGGRGRDAATGDGAGADSAG